MAFHFAFDKILHLRVGVERQEEQRLAAISNEIAGIQAEIGVCTQRRGEVRRAALQEVADGTSGAVLQFAVTCDAAAAELEKRLKGRLRAAETARARQFEVYRQARQGRETFERLRDRRMAEYQRNAARRDQQNVDEDFLVRHSRESED